MATLPFCPGHDALQHFSLGQLRESEAAGLEAHLAGCPRCVAPLHDLGLAPLVEKLAEGVAETITKQADKPVAKAPPKVDRIAALKAKLKGTRPTVMVQISQRHFSGGSFDPAALAEIAKDYKETGFTLIDPEEGSKGKADILISGEAFSEIAICNGRLASVKARVELKVTDPKEGTILVADRQTALVVDLAEQSAAKAALEEAAAIRAERVLPKLVK